MISLVVTDEEKGGGRLICIDIELVGSKNSDKRLRIGQILLSTSVATDRGGNE